MDGSSPIFQLGLKNDNQLKIAAKTGMENVQVVIEDAYIMYMRKGWFKSKILKIGRPAPGQKIVVVYYNTGNQINTVEPAKPIPIIKVKKIILQVANSISTGAKKLKAIIIEIAKRNNTSIVSKGFKQIPFDPSFYKALAA